MVNPVDFLCFTLLRGCASTKGPLLNSEPRLLLQGTKPAGAERARCSHRYGAVALIIRGGNKSCHLWSRW